MRGRIISSIKDAGIIGWLDAQKRAKTISLLKKKKKKKGENLSDLGLGKDFKNRTRIT